MDLFLEILGLMWDMLPVFLVFAVPITLAIALLISLFNTKTVVVRGKKYYIPNKGFKGWLVWLYDFGVFLLCVLQLHRIPGLIGYRRIVSRQWFNVTAEQINDWVNDHLITNVKMKFFSTTGNVTLHRRGWIDSLTAFAFLYNNGVVRSLITSGKQNGRISNQGELGRVVYNGPIVSHKGATHMGEIAVDTLDAKQSFFGYDIFVQNEAVFDRCIFADGIDIFYSNKAPVFKNTPVLPRINSISIGKHFDTFERIKADGIIVLLGDDVAQEKVTTTTKDVEASTPATSTISVAVAVEEIDFEDVLGINPSDAELADLVGEDLIVTSATDQSAKAEAVAEVVSVLSEVILDKETAPGSGEQKVAAVATLASTLSEVADDKATAPDAPAVESTVVFTPITENTPTAVETVVPEIQPGSAAEHANDLQRAAKAEEKLEKIRLEMEMVRGQHKTILRLNNDLEQQLRKCNESHADYDEIKGELAISRDREKQLRKTLRGLEAKVEKLEVDPAAA